MWLLITVSVGRVPRVGRASFLVWLLPLSVWHQLLTFLDPSQQGQSLLPDSETLTQVPYWPSLQSCDGGLIALRSTITGVRSHWEWEVTGDRGVNDPKLLI